MKFVEPSQLKSFPENQIRCCNNTL